VKETSDSELKAVMQSGSDYANQQIKEKQAKMRDFINQTKQDRDYFKEQNYGKVSYNDEISNSDFSKRLKNNITGKKYLNTVDDFQKSLSDMPNKKVSAILQKAYDNIKIQKSQKKKNYFNARENTVYLTNGSSKSTLAHELFHKVDHDNNMSSSGLLDKCLSLDYENIKKTSEKTGLSIEDMLYLNYPEAFEKKGKVKEQYRGFSDIINGLTSGEVNLGYYHDIEYWKKTLKLQKETFAQFGRFYYDNDSDVIKIVNEMLPETSKQMNTLINVISQFGR